VDIERRYLPGTNVLETTFSTPGGVVTLTDFMPVESDEDEIGKAHRLGARHSLIRIVRGVSGSVEVGLTFRPRFEYGLTTPYIRELASDLVVAIGGADALLLESEIGPLPRDGRGGVDASDVVRAGDERVISITWSTPSGLDTSRIPHAEAIAELDSTVRFWGTWSEHTRYEGPYRVAVERSALAIKGLTDGKTGAVIAAASTSLPETIGGGRNWDYRYTWVRDSTTMLTSLVRLGHDYECRRFSEWIRYTTAGRADELQIMYGLGGERITAARVRYASGTARGTSRSSTPTVGCWPRPGSARPTPVSLESTEIPTTCASSTRSSTSRSSASMRWTKASGRYAAAAGISSSPSS